MTRSELIETILSRQAHLSSKDVELAVKTILEHMSKALSNGERIEIRGFGSFNIRRGKPRIGRNPKTGAPVDIKPKNFLRFRAGKGLREGVKNGMQG